MTNVEGKNILAGNPTTIDEFILFNLFNGIIISEQVPEYTAYDVYIGLQYLKDFHPEIYEALPQTKSLHDGILKRILEKPKRERKEVSYTKKIIEESFEELKVKFEKDKEIVPLLMAEYVLPE